MSLAASLSAVPLPAIAAGSGDASSDLIPLIVNRSENFDHQVLTFSLATPEGRRQLSEQCARLLVSGIKSNGQKSALIQSIRWLTEYDEPNVSRVRQFVLARQIRETLVSFDSNFLSPEPVSGDILDFPFYLSRPIGRGQSPASNLVLPSGIHADAHFDVSLLQPATSSFWQPPSQISRLDLFSGYGRRAATRPPASACTYQEKKGGYGTNGGFSILCGGMKYKTKWGSEVHVEPFNSRVVRALGYDTKTSDYWPGVVLKYDRRIFSEYNIRDDLSVHIHIASIPLTRLRIFRRLDPFAIVTSVTLKNGQSISPSEFKRRLLKSSEQGAEGDQNNYNTDFETQVENVHLAELAVQIPDLHAETVGGWGWGDLGYYGDNLLLAGSSLGHENLRELRGFGVLAAWLNIYDMRWDNNKLRLISNTDGTMSLRHMISDLGSGLGKADDLFGLSNSDVNAFPWRFTAPSIGPTVEIKEYKTADRNLTFEKMTLDDARWMARLIAQLSPSQIEQALAASGFSQAEVFLYSRKLLVRRDLMMKDFGLPNAPAITSANVGQPLGEENRNFVAEPLAVQTLGGALYYPPVKGCAVRNGQMICGN